ncbi:uncharacterized protein BX664DRAFT_362580 [Halteromyces radiatus]|uniref:uncharacterized protein n=1 Tax=Halteromyces radiatus TaxID=101107 RepID=UPI00221E6C71|nr:uncharacterized protein BX664DRAFT_362580 [Halteromyces radiatus]KAI8077796.1 hypothetical protein BX664DRAFT_362580 [Halteromyces radiatus]
MRLQEVNLQYLDSLNDHEDVTRNSRVYTHIKNQQSFISQAESVTPIPKHDNTKYSTKCRGIVHASKLPPSPNRPSHISSPSLLTLDRQSQSPESFINKQNRHCHQHHDQQQEQQSYQNKFAGKKRQRYQEPRETKKLIFKKSEIRLLEKFTSPNIGIDHITVRSKMQSRSRVGLFNKGKSSARGSIKLNKQQGVSDLVFSEASFLCDPFSHSSFKSKNINRKNDKYDDTDIHKINDKNITDGPSMARPLHHNEVANVTCSSTSSEAFTDYFDSLHCHRSPTTPQQQTTSLLSDWLHSSVASPPTNHTSLLQNSTALPSLPIVPRKSCSPIQQKGNCHSYEKGVTFQQSNMDHFLDAYGATQQVPHYTRGITPCQAPFGCNTDLHDEQQDIIIGNDQTTPISHWKEPFITGRQQQQGNVPDIIDEAASSSKSSYFTSWKGPQPFQPNNQHLYDHNDIGRSPSITNSSISALASELRFPRLPPPKPIYNIAAIENQLKQRHDDQDNDNSSNFIQTPSEEPPSYYHHHYSHLHPHASLYLGSSSSLSPLYSTSSIHHPSISPPLLPHFWHKHPHY